MSSTYCLEKLDFRAWTHHYFIGTDSGDIETPEPEVNSVKNNYRPPINLKNVTNMPANYRNDSSSNNWVEAEAKMFRNPLKLYTTLHLTPAHYGKAKSRFGSGTGVLRPKIFPIVPGKMVYLNPKKRDPQNYFGPSRATNAYEKKTSHIDMDKPFRVSASDVHKLERATRDKKSSFLCSIITRDKRFCFLCSKMSRNRPYLK